MINEKAIIESLLEKYGSPLYVFDKKQFIKNYLQFEKCMKKSYDKYQLSFSYKTNYAPYICKIVKQLGGYAEVVSDMEYYIAKSIGYEDSHIIYNGPYKGKLSYQLLKNGGRLNVDSIDELNRLVLYAKNNKKNIFNIGLRLNFDIGQGFISRFGIDVNTELADAIKTIDGVDNLNIVGLHCHIGKSRSVESWKKRSEEMIKIIDSFFRNTKLNYIDLGSGMYGKMNDFLGKQFGSNLPKYSDYAKTIGDVFNDYYKHYSYDDKPILFTEPGTTLVNSYIDFISTVFSIKKIRNKQFVVLDCSKHNIGEICTLKKLPIKVFSNNKNRKKLINASFVGYTCLEHDILFDGYNGGMSVGDYVVFHNVGGYSNVSKPPFILPNCAMISVDNNTTDIIKRREEYEDIIRTYAL